MMPNLRLVRHALWALVIVAAAAGSGVWVGRLIADEPALLSPGSVGAALVRSRYQDAGGPFTMTDMDGATVTEQDFRGRPLAMFFGFRNCPDVCPTTMLDAHRWLEALGPDADRLTVAFVTVDPERDTPEALKQYLRAFDERIVGLTPGTPEALETLAREYAVLVQKVELGNGDYTMNHTSDMLLFDADGGFAGFIPYAPPSLRQDPAGAARAEAAAVDTLRALVS